MECLFLKEKFKLKSSIFSQIPLIPQNRAPKYTFNELREVLLKSEDVEDGKLFLFKSAILKICTFSKRKELETILLKTGVFHRYLNDSSRWEKIPIRKQNSAATLSINDFQVLEI